jgi:uncharacterized protein (DUF1684 family)
MHVYQIEFRYEDRQNGTTKNTMKQEGSTIPVAIAKATRTFFKLLDRKQRFDATKGLSISCIRDAAADVAPVNPSPVNDGKGGAA